MGLNKQKKQDYKIVGIVGKQLKTYTHLFRAAQLSLTRAQKDKNEDFYDSMMCVLFCALSLEAYFNHIGSSEFQFWEEDLERLSPKAKLRLIASERLQTKEKPSYERNLRENLKKRNPVEIVVDFSQRPFQSFVDIFRVRNQLAHGKTKLFLAEVPVQNNPKVDWDKADRETFCTTKQAERLLNDTEEMIIFIHSEIYGKELDPFLSDFKFSGEVFGGINVK